MPINDEVTLISESKSLLITRLAALKLFEINGNQYDYDTIFTGQQRLIYWQDNEEKALPQGFLYDLDKDNAPLIKPIRVKK